MQADQLIVLLFPTRFAKGNERRREKLCNDQPENRQHQGAGEQAEENGFKHGVFDIRVEGGLEGVAYWMRGS
ncbi:hypothetical protein BK640_13855 [Pseudomonas protegens]|nr:hypothetical protein BK639_03270 [Pseudomonas protegens]ROM02910.1 hypothetical protein BK640_13855 [Pseudomonas protegens]